MVKKSVFLLLCVVALFSLNAGAQATQTPETKSTFSISDSTAFKGKYKFEGLPFEYVDLSVRDNKLFFVGGEYNGPLEPSDKKDAFNVNGEAVFSFSRNAENKITELKIDYNGQSFVGKKEEKKD